MILVSNIIAEKIRNLTQQRDQIERVIGDMDNIDSPQAAALDNKLKRVTENLYLFEQLAFIFIEKDETIEQLTQQVHRQYDQISALRQMNERLTIRAQAAQAVAALYQSKWDDWNKEKAETTSWLKNMVAMPNSEFETHLKNLNIETI